MQPVTKFLFNLSINVPLPEGVGVLFPFTEAATQQACTAFYEKYYGDGGKRQCIIGINPGRFGGGITGIPFTDPIRLQNVCGIPNSWAMKQELSSVFIYDMIAAFGGPEKFYSRFYITSVSPLGFVKNDKNLNYYDDKNLEQAITPFAISCLNEQLSWGYDRDTAFCFGEGKNFAFLQKLNGKHHFFKQIIPLPHPRFIMQYKLKQKQDYINQYLQKFGNV